MEGFTPKEYELYLLIQKMKKMIPNGHGKWLEEIDESLEFIKNLK